MFLDYIQDNLNCIHVSLTQEHSEKASKIKLGFPHDFIAGEGVQDIVYADFEITK